jgi:uncharacterized protein YjiS (DUF1127 family)
MSQSFIVTRPGPRSNVKAGLHVLSTWVAAIETWLIRRRGWQDLSQLDDRLLKDIGISQEEALWSARKPFWRHRGVHLSSPYQTSSLKFLGLDLEDMRCRSSQRRYT